MEYTVIDVKGYKVKIDTEDYDRINKISWYAHKERGRIYICADKFLYGQRIGLKLHRYIMNCPVGMVVDHINGDTLDNRKCNLRICSQRENARNSKTPRTNKTGFKGVICYKNKDGSISFRARIKSNRVQYYLGTFDTIEDAVIAYENKSKELFGEYARALECNIDKDKHKGERLKVMRTNTSGLTGIIIDKRTNKYIAQKNVKLDGKWKHISIGRYNTLGEAKEAYDKYINKHKEVL
jgi:hypothetical protein